MLFLSYPMQVQYVIMSFLSVLTVSSINANGWRDNLKREILFDYIVRSKINIVCMQETHSECEDERFWRRQWQGEIHFSHGSRNSKGVAILISYI